MSVLTAGSVAIDAIKTPEAEAHELLGGSASYAALAASFYSPVNLVSIVGKDFPEEHVKLFEGRNIDLSGVEVADGKTFRWHGEYHENLNNRDTLDVQLNVLEHYKPVLTDAYKQSRIILLANAGPDSQMEVLNQCDGPVFSIADTMDLWIMTMREQLLELLPRIDLLVLNDSEARQLTEKHNLILAGEKLLEMGCKAVALKKGEHGAMLFTKEGDFFTGGAFPLRSVHDPTGAGDSFVGGMAGYLASTGKASVSTEDIIDGIIHGTVLASFTCEEFGLRRLEGLQKEELKARYDQFLKYSRMG